MTSGSSDCNVQKLTLHQMGVTSGQRPLSFTQISSWVSGWWVHGTENKRYRNERGPYTRNPRVWICPTRTVQFIRLVNSTFGHVLFGFVKLTKEFRIIKKMNNKRRSNPSKLQNYQASRGDRNHKNDYNYKDDRQDDLPRQRKLGYVEKLLNSFGFIQSIDDVSNSQGKIGIPGRSFDFDL